MPTRTKTPMETRLTRFNLEALISIGAALTSVQILASRKTTVQSTTLAALVAIGDDTIHLSADPGLGALLIIDPSGASEETLKVTNVTPHSGHFDATVTPIAWAGHSNGATVNYEPGVNARLLVDDTPTPSGAEFDVMTQKGADGHTYRISAIAPCDDGQIVEDEFDLIVSDVAATATNVKQATETRDIEADLSPLLNEPHQVGVTIASATAFASQQGSLTTTLAALANPEAGTLSLTANPGIGAFLTVNPGQANQEKVHVSNVTGAGPYTATINPSVEFSHSNGESVSFETGVTAGFLVSPTSSIADPLARNRARRGAVGKTFRMVWLATASNGERLQHSGLVAVQEV